MTPDERASLRAHILEAGLAGDTRTPRSSVVKNAEALADDDPDKRLGIGRRGRDAEGIMRAVADLCGCSPSLDERDGPGVIDADRLLDGFEAVAGRIAEAARERQRVLITTGHPTGVLPMYHAVSRALAAAGAPVLTPVDEDTDVEPPKPRKRSLRICFLDGVGVLGTLADLLHTHESWPMEHILDALADEPPDLVLADHGYAGAAIARGLDVACFTDVNDPAIAVAWADGLVERVVPIDDNRRPVDYEPLTRHLVSRIEGA